MSLEMIPKIQNYGQGILEFKLKMFLKVELKKSKLLGDGKFTLVIAVYADKLIKA